jgi:hypothetical protein
MRKLSQEFMTDLKEGGILSPIREAVIKDKDLILEIRDDIINIYYRGGRNFELKHLENSKYAVSEFDRGYTEDHPREKEIEKELKELENKEITTQDDIQRCVDNIRSFKEIMDYHYYNSKRFAFEKNIQQLIVQENNRLPFSGPTDYFIIDWEYNAKTQFDLVGLFWDRRKRNNPKSCKLVIIEVKYGDKSLDDVENGLNAHITKTKECLDDEKWVKSFKEEMIGIITQKLELGLLNFNGEPLNSKVKKETEEEKERVDNFSQKLELQGIEFMFIIAGHNPGSIVLKNELDKVEKELDKPGSKLNQDNVRFAVSSFFGYALFKENMKSLSEFKALL